VITLLLYSKVHKKCTFLLNILFNIDDTASRVPLFERALQTDVLDVVLVYEVNYCESNRYCKYVPPIITPPTQQISGIRGILLVS